MVLRPGALGDTILTFDALAALRRAEPGASMELVGNGAAGALLAEGGLADDVLAFDATEVMGLFQLPPHVPERWRGARLVVLWLASGEAIAEAFRAAGAGSVLHAPPAPSDEQHVADHLVHSLGAAGVAPVPGSERWQLTLGRIEFEGCRPEGRAFRPASGPAVHGGGTHHLLSGKTQALATRAGPGGREPLRAIVHPGSGSPRKNWPADRVADLASRLVNAGWSVALLEGPADASAVASARAALGPLLRALDVMRPSDLSGLTRSVATASLFVGNDSGVAHLAGRLGVPTVAIFGPTDPRQWAPRGPAVQTVGGGGNWPGVDEVLRASGVAEKSRHRVRSS